MGPIGEGSWAPLAIRSMSPGWVGIKPSGIGKGKLITRSREMMWNGDGQPWAGERDEEVLDWGGEMEAWPWPAL